MCNDAPESRIFLEKSCHLFVKGEGENNDESDAKTKSHYANLNMIPGINLPSFNNSIYDKTKMHFS